MDFNVNSFPPLKYKKDAGSNYGIQSPLLDRVKN